MTYQHGRIEKVKELYRKGFRAPGTCPILGPRGPAAFLGMPVGSGKRFWRLRALLRRIS